MRKRGKKRGGRGEIPGDSFEIISRSNLIGEREDDARAAFSFPPLRPKKKTSKLIVLANERGKTPAIFLPSSRKKRKGKYNSAPFSSCGNVEIQREFPLLPPFKEKKKGNAALVHTRRQQRPELTATAGKKDRPGPHYNHPQRGKKRGKISHLLSRSNLGDYRSRRDAVLSGP